MPQHEETGEELMRRLRGETSAPATPSVSDDSGGTALMQRLRGESIPSQTIPPPTQGTARSVDSSIFEQFVGAPTRALGGFLAKNLSLSGARGDPTLQEQIRNTQFTSPETQALTAEFISRISRPGDVQIETLLQGSAIAGAARNPFNPDLTQQIREAQPLTQQLRDFEFGDPEQGFFGTARGVQESFEQRPLGIQLGASLLVPGPEDVALLGAVKLGGLGVRGIKAASRFGRVAEDVIPAARNIEVIPLSASVAPPPTIQPGVGNIGTNVSLVSPEGQIRFDLLSDIAQPPVQQGPIQGFRSGLGDVDIGVPGQQNITISGEGTLPISGAPPRDPSVLSDPSDVLLGRGARLVPENRIDLSGVTVPRDPGSQRIPEPFGGAVIRQSDEIIDDVVRDALPDDVIVESVSSAGNKVISSKSGGAVISPNQGLKDSFGLPDRTVGLSRPQRLMNMLAGVLGPKRIGPIRRIPSFFGAGRTQTIPLIRNIMDDARAIVRQSKSLSNAVRPTLTRAIDKAFTVNRDGLITNPSLLGIEGRLPGGITLKTLAARLPNYWNDLNTQQRAVMTRVREALEEPRQWIGREELPDATNIVRSTDENIPSGFYVPSRVIDRGVDPVKPITSSVRDPLASSTDEPLIFKGTPDGPSDALTQEEAIGGFVDSTGNFRQVRYSHPGDAIADAIEAWGKQASRNYTADALSPNGFTPKQIAIKNNPELWAKIFEMRGQLARLKNVLKLPERQLDELISFFDDPLFDDINVVFNAVDKRIARGQFQDANFEQLQEFLAATKEYMRTLTPQWEEALTLARKDSDEFISIGPQRLEQRKFPIAMADAARDHLRRLAPPGQLDALNNDLNGFYTGFRATGDDSFAGIQGWLSLFDNPVRWSKIFVAHYQGFFDLRYIGGYIDDYNLLTNRTVRVKGLDHILPTVEEAATRAGLGIQGRTSAASIERGVGGALSDRVFTRGKFNPLARLNNLWSVFGDRIRMDTFRDEVIEQLGQGRRIDDLWNSGDMRQIAGSINRDTGFVNESFGGTAGQRVLFASKWLQSRLESVVVGGAGIRDPRILIEVLPGGRNIAQASRLPLNQRQTARRFWRLITYATALTVGVNEWARLNPETAKIVGLEPNETYLQPRINGRLNPNFMKFRWQSRDLSFYGPFHSIYNMMHRLATGGSPVDVISGLAAGTVSVTKDLVDIVNGGGDFRSRSDIGERAVMKAAGLVTDREFDSNALNERQEFSAEARAIQTAGRILEIFTTFGAEEIFESGEDIGEGRSIEGAVGIGSEILGTQSAPLSPSDVADRIARDINLPNMAIAQPYQQRILNSFPDVELRREDFVPNLRQVKITKFYDDFDKRTEQIMLLKGLGPTDKASLYLDAEGELFNGLKALRAFNAKYEDPFAALASGEIQSEEDALDGWYSLRNLESSNNPRRGQPGGRPLDQNRKDYLDTLPENLANYVIRNTNLRVPPDAILRGISVISSRRWRMIRASQAARRTDLEQIGAEPDLAEMLKVLP